MVCGLFAKKLKSIFICSSAVLKVAIYTTEQVAIIFIWKVVKCTKVLIEIPFFHGEPL